MGIQAQAQAPRPSQESQIQDLAAKITEVMQNQFGLKPKRQTYMYKTPYPSHYDQIPYPQKFKMPDFTKFSGQDDTSTVEHVNRFIIQCGEAASSDALRVRLFSLSLSGSAFQWFTSLPANSIHHWADLEKQFHQFFYTGIHEMKLTDLTNLRQRNDESVAAFIQRFRDIKNRCYSLVLSDSQLADIAFQGLLPYLKEKYGSQEFESISQIVHRMSGDNLPFETRKNNYIKKINVADYSDDSGSEDENEIGLAEWVKNKKPISCPFGKKEPEKFGFDITKADRIFDLLLKEGQIKLLPHHRIPSADELKKMKYCKWHNVGSHDTNDCKVFRQQIQTAIEQGRIKFEVPTKPMNIDQNPFPTNMVDAGDKKNALQTKLLTSQSAKASGAVDPKVQVSVRDLKQKGKAENAETSKPLKKKVTWADEVEFEKDVYSEAGGSSHASPGRITSQHLISKFQRDNDRRRHEEEMRRQEEEHWRCPFFIYCWEEGLTLPSIEDCPECNGLCRSNRFSKRPRYEGRNGGPIIRNHHERIPARDRLRGERISVHERLEVKKSVYDRLGGRLSEQNQLEEMANNLVPDEQPFRRDPEMQKEPQEEMPRWCPRGLTRSQKRRVQRLRSQEQWEEEQRRALEKKKVKSQVWRVKPKADDDHEPGSSAAPVHMVFTLSREFMAPADSEEGSDIEEAMAQLNLEPAPATFVKPEEEDRRHLKALFMKGYIDGKPMTKMLVDGGAAVNIMPYAVLRKLGKGEEDLTKTDMMLKDFEGVVTPARGALCVDLTIGSKSLPTTFFVINGKGSYNVLLGRDWIHANCCIPSTMHQCLVQWIGDVVEIVSADSSSNIALADLPKGSYERTSCISGEIWETDFLKVADYDIQPIQAVGSVQMI